MVEVIIVSYNTRELLKNCLTSVLTNCAQSKIPYGVTVIDNASNDGSLEMMRKEFPQVKLITNDSNIGFAKANNQGIASSVADYFFLLNSDTILCSDVISGLLHHLDSHSNVAMAGCKLLLPDGTHQVGDAGYRPSLLSFISFAFFLSKLFPVRSKGFYLNINSNADYMPVDWVSGAALFVRRSFVQEAGPMTEKFFMYAEDTEWGIRARNSGWEVHYLPRITINHLAGAYLKKEAPTLWLHNSYLLLQSTKSKREARWAMAVLGVGFLIRFVLYLAIAMVTNNNKHTYKKMIVWARECFKISINDSN